MFQLVKTLNAAHFTEWVIFCFDSRRFQRSLKMIHTSAKRDIRDEFHVCREKKLILIGQRDERHLNDQLKVILYLLREGDVFRYRFICSTTSVDCNLLSFSTNKIQGLGFLLESQETLNLSLEPPLDSTAVSLY